MQRLGPLVEAVTAFTLAHSITLGLSALALVSSTITRTSREVAPMARLPNIHPGEVLREEFLIPLGLSQSRVARDINVPPRRINEIVLEKRAITADTALRLARYFGTSERFWLGLQADYELEEARRMLAGRLEKEVRRHAA